MRGGGHGGDYGQALARAQAFHVGEEVPAALADGTAQVAAELIRRRRGLAGAIEEIARIENGIAELLVRGSMQFARSGAGVHADAGAGRVTRRSGNVTTQQTHSGDRLGRWIEQGAAGPVVVVIHIIQQEAVVLAALPVGVETHIGAEGIRAGAFGGTALLAGRDFRMVVNQVQVGAGGSLVAGRGWVVEDYLVIGAFAVFDHYS